MPVASSASLTTGKGRGRGRGRWAGNPFPSSDLQTRGVSVTPPSTPVWKASGEESPPESPGPRNGRTVTSSPTSNDCIINGDKTQFLSMGPKVSGVLALATSTYVQKVQCANSRTAHTGEIPQPPVACIQKSQSSNQISKDGKEVPSPSDAWMHRSRSQNWMSADGISTTPPSHPYVRNIQSKSALAVDSRELPDHAKVLSQTQIKMNSRTRNSAEELLTRDRGKQSRLEENRTPHFSSNSQMDKTSPRGSQPRSNEQSPPVPSRNGVHVKKGQTFSALPINEASPQPTSTNIWVLREQAREAIGGGTPLPSPRGGGGRSPCSASGGSTPLPESEANSPWEQSRSPAPGSPCGRSSEENPPPLSPRGKDGSGSSEDSYTDDAELEGLLGLPDHVLMYNRRDPVSVLMEYGQTREVKVKFTEMSRSGPHHASRFHTAAIVGDETHVQATGTSKKTAKKAAATLALRTMYERGMANLQLANTTVNRELKEMEAQQQQLCEEDDPRPDLPQQGRPGWPCLGTRVMHVSRRLLEVAEETQFINYSKDKVLAAVVLERRGTYTVVGLGTGNRCIQYQNLPTNGSRVIHSHAEIIARRAFIRYMLKELARYRSIEKHPLFRRSRHTGQLKLHDDIRVHLYISRPPCGDAAAFPTITNIPNRMRAIRKQGQLRTIIDDGEGAIPTEFPLPANANGKERLRVMTCSDKILRWNALGIQGALLSNFMNPVYLSSVVIGSHTGDQRGHVPRAISGRLKCGRLHEVLMKPFRICSPEIVYPPHSDNYAITKSKQYCITWSEGDPDAEVIDAVSGAVAMEPTEDSPSSRVCKRTLLALFRQTCSSLRADHLATLTYAEAKAAARAYQRTKKSVEAHLQSCGFGQWLSLHQTYGVDSFEDAEKLQ